SSSRIVMSKWKENSSLTAASTSRTPRSRRNSRRNLSEAPMSSSAGELQDARHGAGVAIPDIRLGGELTPSGGREPVELRLSIVLRQTPLAREPASLLQAVECGVEGAL